MLELKTLAKSGLFSVTIFQATAKLEEEQFFHFFFQQTENCFETGEKTTI